MLYSTLLINTGAIVPPPPSDSWSSGSSTGFTARSQASFLEAFAPNLEMQSFAAATVGNRTYVTGGYNSGYLGTNQAYDMSTNDWHSLASMGTPRFGHASASVGTKAYVFGGSNGSELDSVECYDTAGNSWSSKASMPSASRYVAACAVGTNIYVFGGYGTYTTQIYDTVGNSWTTGTNVPYGIQSATAAAVGTKIYLIGGSSGGSIATNNYEYDTVGDTWSAKTSHPASGSHASALSSVSYLSRIYTFSGSNLIEADGGTWRYDPSLEGGTPWVNLSSMSTSLRTGTVAGLSGGKACVIGGHDHYPSYTNFNTNEIYTI